MSAIDDWADSMADELLGLACDPKPFTITVVPDEYGACPRCGAYWGHPDKALDFPNRNKVDHLWRCYNPGCTAGYYDPDSGEVVEDKPTPEQAAESQRRAEEYMNNLMRGRKWVTRKLGNGCEESRLEDESYVLKAGEK
jgi:hypothetical protein